MSASPRLHEAATAIRAGEIVGVPTDTVYGLAVDPWNEAAVASLYEAKGRPEHKPVGLLAASMGQVEEIVDLGSARAACELHWPGALTVVVRPRVVIPNWLGNRALGTVGIRIPDAPDLRELMTATGPLAVTSANRSSEAETFDDGAARSVFGKTVAVYLEGKAPGEMASTVVDATGTDLVVLRQGVVVIDGGD